MLPQLQRILKEQQRLRQADQQQPDQETSRTTAGSPAASDPLSASEDETGSDLEDSETTYDSSCYGLADDVHLPAFIDFRFNDGGRLACPYKNIVFVSFEEDGPLEIRFGDYMATIDGENLVPELYEAIVAGKVAWIMEASADYDQPAGGEVWVESIIVQDSADQGEEEEE